MADCFIDHRTPERVVHQLPGMMGQRIAGNALGYEDIEDHDELRHDPVLALLSDKLAAKRAELCGAGGQEYAEPPGACA